MSFSAQQFPQQAGIRRAGTSFLHAPDVVAICQKRYKESVRILNTVNSGGPTLPECVFVFPIGTDVRDAQIAGGGSDWIEHPLGSGNQYLVQVVEDDARGFINQARHAVAYRYEIGTAGPYA